jgi:hypothetical protein
MNATKPGRIPAESLGQAAAESVTRAVEARRRAGVELSNSEAQQISGGLVPIIRGIPPVTKVLA